MLHHPLVFPLHSFERGGRDDAPSTHFSSRTKHFYFQRRGRRGTTLSYFPTFSREGFYFYRIFLWGGGLGGICSIPQLLAGLAKNLFSFREGREGGR